MDGGLIFGIILGVVGYWMTLKAIDHFKKKPTQVGTPGTGGGSSNDDVAPGELEDFPKEK